MVFMDLDTNLNENTGTISLEDSHKTDMSKYHEWSMSDAIGKTPLTPVVLLGKSTLVTHHPMTEELLSAIISSSLKTTESVASLSISDYISNNELSGMSSSSLPHQVVSGYNSNDLSAMEIGSYDDEESNVFSKYLSATSSEGEGNKKATYNNQIDIRSVIGEISAGLLGEPTRSIGCCGLQERMIEQAERDKEDGYDENNPRPGTLAHAVRNLR